MTAPPPAPDAPGGEDVRKTTARYPAAVHRQIGIDAAAFEVPRWAIEWELLTLYAEDDQRRRVLQAVFARLGRDVPPELS